MNPADYLKVLRRRWRDLALAVALALGAGFVISSLGAISPPHPSYSSTSYLVTTSTGLLTPNVPNLQALAELATIGDVPERVAEELPGRQDPYQLASMIRTRANVQTGIMSITAISPQRAQVRPVATAFAGAVVSYLREQQARAASREAGSLLDRMEQLEGEIDNLEARIASSPPSAAQLLQAERDAKIRQYGLQYESYQQIAAASTGPIALQILEATEPQQLQAGGIQPPRSTTGILVLSGFLGLLAGVVLVLVLDRFDTRIRNRQDAEQHFGLPVLADIPHVSRARRGESITLPGKPGAPDLPGSGPPRTILVTSPGPSDGKTTVVANLALTLGEHGKRVLVLSCDLRRPMIHHMFGIPNGTGLTDALRSPNGEAVLEGRVLQTPVRGVWMVPSGGSTSRPMELLASDRMRQAIREARDMADIVLLDSPPILTASDAAPLMTEVEAVVVVARAGRTTYEVAERTGQLLKQLEISVRGVALNAVREMPVPRGYYGYYYRKEDRRRGKVRDFPDSNVTRPWSSV
jgi:capsular exopolysaccharide synthesis family protein